MSWSRRRDASQRPPEIDAYERALSLVARREHFWRELEIKLRQRGYAEESIGEALDRLVERGALDDARAARAFVRERLRRGAFGRRRLEAELRQRGVDGAQATAALDEVLEDSPEIDRARAAAARRPSAETAALARYLERRGFAAATIASILAERRAKA
ncbi:MAG: regulatory protein RecX [Acidobacteriota bacterium]